MRTPAGFECNYFYGDYYRGRNFEECRLLKDTDPSQNWKPSLCVYCPIPAIIRANACQSMRLEGRIEKYFFGFKNKVSVNAFCIITNQNVIVPEIGCGQCHPVPEIFIEGDQ